jgi:hypothetical protein
MSTDVTITTIAHVIQLAVAPVFLLTGVGALLGVLTSRLSRIINRRRALHDFVTASEKIDPGNISREFGVLVRRGHLINRAISLCTISALLVCIVVAALFAGAFLKVDLSILIGVLFITTMLALVGGLIYFLREIHLAMDFASSEMNEEKSG